MLQHVCIKLTVKRVLSQLERGCIFVGECDSGQSWRVKFQGADYVPEPGDVFEVAGIERPFRDRFGRDVCQIESNRMKRLATYGALLGPFLQRLPNIGSVRARRLADHFGAELIRALSDPARLNEVAGILEPSKPALSARLATQLYAAVAVASGADELKEAEAVFLAELEGLGLKNSRVAGQVWRLMAGTDALERLKRHPYVLATMLPWREADRIGRRLLESATESKGSIDPSIRVAGAVQSVWSEVLAAGDTAISVLGMHLGLVDRKVDPEAAIARGLLSRLLRPAGDLLFRAPGAAWLEDQIMATLAKIESDEPNVSVPAGERTRLQLIAMAERRVGLTLSSEQRQAVADLLLMPVGALQGGAGVGKTTVMKVLSEVWEQLGGNVVLSALAGKAALTLARGASSQARPRLAYTVARIIGMLERRRAVQGGSEAISSTNDVEFNSRTLVVVDEAGMLDLPSLDRLISLLPTGARILFAGDVGQLPPVGIGAFFHLLVAEGSRVVSLTQIRRQGAGSSIPSVARQVRDGHVPKLTPWQGEAEGVYLIPPEELLPVQRSLRAKRETMVVAALRRTVSFVNESEAAARRAANIEEVRVAPDVYVAVGDPVVMNSNRYADGLFNGLLGTVTEIGDRIAVHWDGNAESCEVTKEAASEMELAYAITCHKAQGSAADAVIVAVEKSEMVSREWLYTAVTRGRSLVLLAGDVDAVASAVSRRTVRCTGMTIGAAGRQSVGDSHHKILTGESRSRD